MTGSHNPNPDNPDELVSQMRNLAAPLVRNDDAAVAWRGADRIEQLTRRVEELEGERDKLTEDYLFCKRQWHQEAERAENLENKARSSDVSGEGV